MLLAFVFYGNGVLKRILNLKAPENSQVSSEENLEVYKSPNNIDNKKKIKFNQNNDNISDIKDLQKKESFESSKNNEINKLLINNNKNVKINNKNNIKNMSKNSSIYDYNINNNQKDSINKDESIPIDSVSSKNYKPNPPRKSLKKAESITTKAGGEEKDIISNEPSILKKYQSSEISYESYKGEKPILIDNLLENGVEYEKIQRKNKGKGNCVFGMFAFWNCGNLRRNFNRCLHGSRILSKQKTATCNERLMQNRNGFR